MRGLVLWGMLMVGVWAEPERGHLGLVTGLAADGKMVYSCSRGGVFRGQGEKALEQLADLEDHATGLALGERHEERGVYVVGGEPGVAGMLVWASSSENSTRSEVLRHDLGKDLCYAVARSDSGGLAVGRADGRVDLLDGDGKERRAAVHQHSGPVLAVAFSPDGRWLASAGRDGLIKLSATGTPEKIRSLLDHTAGVESLAFSPDSRFLVSGSRDAKVRLHAVDGSLVRTYQGLGMAEEPVAGRVVAHVLALAWDREHLVAGTSNGRLFRLSLVDAEVTALGHQDSAPISSLLLQKNTLLIGGRSRITEFSLENKKGVSRTADP